MSIATLSLHNVSKQFTQGSSTLTVLAGITVEFTQGLTYALVGASGTGKSTLLTILAGLEQPTTGSVVCNGRTLAHNSREQHRNFLHTSLGLVFQTPHLLPELSVEENVMIKGLIAGMPRADCNKKARELLEAVSLTDKALNKPSTLSGGEQQRVALARALFIPPLFLLADEPTAHLGEAHKADIIKLLCRFQEQYNTGLIISSHDMSLASLMNTVFELRDGILHELPRSAYPCQLYQPAVAF
jgi:ABC-type lipoprotein export system ATPase subunit